MKKTPNYLKVYVVRYIPICNGICQNCGNCSKFCACLYVVAKVHAAFAIPLLGLSKRR